MSVRRREFIAGLGGFTAGVGLGGISHWLPLAPINIGSDWAPEREQFVASTCLLCPSHCGIRGRIVDGKLVRIDGNPLHPVSRGGLCPKGSAGIQLLYHPGRLKSPMERTGPPGSGEFRSVSWSDALQRIATRLAELRDSGAATSVGWLSGNVTGIMGELPRRFVEAYGTPHLFEERYSDGADDVLRLSQGLDASPAFDLENSDLVLSFGAALAEAWWCLPQASWARAVEDGGGPRWVQVDTRFSRTAARSDEWIAVRPGTYGTLALGLAYVILKEGLYDAEDMRSRSLGIEDWTDAAGNRIEGFRSLVLRWGRTERISEQTGIPRDEIVRLAKRFAAAARPVAVWDQSVAWRRGGLADAMAIHGLNVLCGRLDRKGGVLVQPELPAPSLGSAAPRGDAPAAELDDLPGLDLQVLFMYYANPVASRPAGKQLAETLDRIPMVVSFSPFLDESARHADLILPDHTYLERWQDAPAPPSVPIPVWGVVQPMVEPMHDTRASGDVLLALAGALGADVAEKLPWTSVRDLVEQRGKALASAQRGGVLDREFKRDELRELEARGWWLPHGKSPDEFWTTLKERGGWFDPYYDYDDRSVVSRLPGGKVWVFPPEARERIESAVSGLAAGFLPVAAGPEAPGNAEYPLRLLPYRVLTLASGGTALMPWLLENLGVLTGDAWEAWVEIHPETGHELGLASGRLVRVQSSEGEFTARLRFFAGAQPGVVNVPYGLHTRAEGWGASDAVNPLEAVGSHRDPSTGLPDWYSTWVRLAPA